MGMSMFNRTTTMNKICQTLNHRYLKDDEGVSLCRRELLAGESKEVICVWSILN